MRGLLDSKVPLTPFINYPLEIINKMTNYPETVSLKLFIHHRTLGYASGQGEDLGNPNES